MTADEKTVHRILCAKIVELEREVEDLKDRLALSDRQIGEMITRIERERHEWRVELAEAGR